MIDAAANHTPAVSDTPEHRSALLDGPQKLALLVGLGGLIAFLVLAGIYFATDHDETTRVQQPFLSFLTGWIFWTLVGLGSVFFLLIQYVTGGRWGILMRRPLEANVRTLFFVALPGFAVVAASMLMGEKSIYWWARHEAHMHHEHKPESEAAKERAAIVEVKQTLGKSDNVKPNLYFDEDEKVNQYLFPAFTIGRGLLYFGVFGALAFWMFKNAKTAEYHENLDVARDARRRQKYVGSFGLFVFAAFMTWIATDWLMSLEPTFSSSMFPVIMFDNAAVTAYAVGLLTLLYLKKKGEPRFANLFPATEQIHLGSLLLAFTLAWTYFNFSQYMLIWIGNLPEEIPYYLKRTRGGWGWYAALAVVFHFPIPFLLLLFRRVKSSPVALRNIAIMLLVVVAFDEMWWISPSMSHEHAPKFYLLLDLAAWVGLGGIWMFVFFGQLKKHPLLPTREVYLLEAYHHGH
jgi:hypothetical protein